MAKPPVVGRVKTRLISPLTARQASDIHGAMVRCVLARVGAVFGGGSSARLILALDDASGPAGGGFWRSLALDPVWQVADQGSGDLGERLARVWRRLGGGPAVFLGSDSPDTPEESLRGVLRALSGADIVLGPVSDGGYWTIAGRRLDARLFDRIDWGTSRVYDQTRAAADRAGLSVALVPRWFDVDRAKDLVALRRRIAVSHDGALMELRAQLDRICEGTQS